MTTYIQDLIDLPERVYGGDFVLKLTEGVEHPEETLKPYVVTPQLRQCFDTALDFIKGAVVNNSSKAAYLHGSFGSGKSHFMAVLHLLLQREPAARSKEGLEAVVSKYNDWLEGKKFLLVPYHMINKASMEDAVLGGYVQRVQELHPEAPIPGVYKAEGLFRDAENLRQSLGDDAFFEKLNAAAKSGRADGWGDLSASWDAASFETARTAGPQSDERARLIGTLVEAFFESYRTVVRGNQEAYVSLDDGLSIISRHAEALGYDALVLFLDELILWLATHAADQAFLNEEGPKVSKLVEAESADRPVPIVSFVARQRDLKELVGDGVTGAEELGFSDVLRWWEARFATITLEDRNLPEIASRRVLVPKSEAARQQLDQAWADTETIREEVFDVLLTPNADREAFRKVYPFSPALMETLIAVSSVLQRERTALKVMMQLLVNQRDTLKLGEIVPVGDLFDVIAEGDEPFTEGMRLHFENAKRLYQRKLLPMLEAEVEASAEVVEGLPEEDPKRQQFRAGDRLLKTLLLAALVPEVDSLKALNSARLAALNHGSIQSPIPGRERQEVLRRVRNWAGQVGEIKIGDEKDPIIALQLSGVDTEGILANAQAIDNAGNRRRKIRELLFEQLHIQDRDEMFLEHEIVWRGTRRTFQVIFGNVRELPDETLRAAGGTRKAILDFPFDEPGHTPLEDLARLEDFRQGGKPSRALVWLPSFLSVSAQKELGILVRLDDILKNEDTFRRYASHLSAVDQAQAREVLRSRRSALRQRIIAYLEAAYGSARAPAGAIDEAHTAAEHFQSLDPSFTPRPPVGGDLHQAFEHLLQQMLESQYPAHPVFGTEIKKSAMLKVQGEVERAAEVQDGRVPIEKPLRALMNQVAVPLQLGEMGETHFVLGRHWYNHFNKQVEGEMTVGKLREAIDEPKPMGLPTLAENLIIQLYANQSNRSFLLHGGPAYPTLDKLPDELELREQKLPSHEVWEEARLRASKLFGLAPSPLLNATNSTGLAAELVQDVAPVQEKCQVLVDRLESLYRDHGLDAAEGKRLRTAKAVLQLVRKLREEEDSSRLAVFASAQLETSPEAMATSFRKVEDAVGAIGRTKWQLFEAVGALQDERREAAEGLRKQLVEVLAADEYAIALRSRLEKLEGDAARLLAGPTKPPPPDSVEPPQPGVEVVGRGDKADLGTAEGQELLAEIQTKLDADDSLRLDLRWKLWREKME